MSDDIHDVLVLFLKCAIFTILRIRGAYPGESFKRRRVFNHLCWWSECTEVEKYVSEVCDSVRPAISRDRLRRVLIPIFNFTGNLQERYAIEFPSGVQGLPADSSEEFHRALVVALIKLELSPSYFAGNSLGTTSATEGVQAQVNAGAPTWSVLVETKEPDTGVTYGGDALGPQWGQGVTSRSAAQGPAGMTVHFLKSVSRSQQLGQTSPSVVVNVYVEENRSTIRC